MTRRYFLDGYNFLFRVFQIDQSLRKHRDELLRALSIRAKSLKMALTIVFDAHNQDQEALKTHIGQTDVVYTGFKQTADDWLIEECETSRRPAQITVISSDKKLLWHVKSLGAATMTIEEFLKKIGTKRRRLLKPAELPPAQGSEYDRWLRLFTENLENDKS